MVLGLRGLDDPSLGPASASRESTDEEEGDEYLHCLTALKTR